MTITKNMKKYEDLLRMIVLLTAFPALLSSCAFIESNQETLWGSAPKTGQEPGTAQTGSPASTSKVAVEDLAAQKGGTLSDIEILWQIPEKEVEGFVLRYGFSRDSLDREAKVSSGELEKFEDPKFGFVYRYILTSVPLNRNLFVSISAFNQGKTSRPSQIIEVPAEKPVLK